ncbi:MAG: InlB B-repeat-containing protein [Clostridia bacterium]|nr:InlB B-repeat-containing protein [Clostridia bacterium]
MMLQKNKSNTLLNALLCVMLICTIFGALFFVKREGVSAKAEASTDITKTISLDNRAWGAKSGEYYFGVMNNGACLNTANNMSDCWYLGNGLVANNNGIDITEYIYVNEKSAKQWITENNQLSSPLVGVNGVTTTPWLSNPAASPVCIRTSSSASNMGIEINILKEAISAPFTLTFKAGFSIIDPNGDTLIISEDVEFAINAAGTPTKIEKYILSFEGMDETKTIKTGENIGELPAVHEKAGYIGWWTIDGKKIDANSTISANKTAAPFYAKDITNTIGLEDRAWGALSGEYYLGVINNGACLNTADNISDCWYLGNGLILNNNGVDITEYIYVNDKSAKQWITENNQLSSPLVGEGDVTTTPWLGNSAASPVCIRTSTASGNMGIMINILKTAISEPLTITFKEGFSVVDPNGEILAVSNDVTYTYAGGTLVDVSRVNVTFDGENAQIVMIGERAVCPAMQPTKEETESHTYAFDGWYNGDTKWNFDDPVQGHMALVSKFVETEKTKYSVTFNADNNTGNVSVPVYVGSYVKEDQIPANPEKMADGALAYSFVCWSLDGENAYDFTTPITENITLTAVYTTKPLYTVTMGDTTVKVVEGGKMEKPADPTKESTAEFDYIFDGWYNGDVKWDFENDTVTSDLELTAKYTEAKRNYTITFNVTGNNAVTFESVTVEYGTTYDLSTLLNGVDVTAYTYTITVDGVAVTSVNVLSNVTVDVAFTARVYYTVTVDGVEQTVEEGAKATKPTVEPTKASTAEYDYTFDGWYNGETEWIFENDTVTSDLDLVAKFTETKRKYTVSFNVTGNDSITFDSVEVEYGTTYDLSKLFDGKDVEGYTYSISVGGVEKASIKVIADTTVDVAFTKKADNNGGASFSMGCMGTISGMGAVLGVMALGVVALMKKKEN